MSDTYVHGTDPAEQDRLATLNRLTNDTFADFLAITPGMRVLDVGSGLGILAAAVAARGAEVVGVERSPEQLAAAVRAPNTIFIQGDVHRLDFPDASFDLVYTRYVLEHVSDPDRVLREMHRVARRGARVVACENDISVMRLDPPAPAFDAAWQALADHQRSLGGDALIGRRLYRLFRNAGFAEVTLSIQPEIHWSGSAGFAAWMRIVIGNIDGARRGIDAPVADRAVAELEAFALRNDASCIFHWNRAVGIA